MVDIEMMADRKVTADTEVMVTMETMEATVVITVAT